LRVVLVLQPGLPGVLGQLKKYVENGGRIRGFAVPASRPEADLFGCLDCVFVQSVPQATQHPQDLDLA
jgi:hypothetical protein